MDTMDRFQNIYNELNERMENLTSKCRKLDAEIDFVRDSLNQAEVLITDAATIINSLDSNIEQKNKAIEDLTIYQALYKDYAEDLKLLIKELDEVEEAKAEEKENREFMKNITEFNRLKNTLNADSSNEHIKIMNALKQQLNSKFQKMFRTQEVLIKDDILPLDYDSFIKSDNHAISENDNIEAEYRAYLNEFFVNKKELYKSEVISLVELNNIMNYIHEKPDYLEQSEDFIVPYSEDNQQESLPENQNVYDTPLTVEKPSEEESESVENNNEIPRFFATPVIYDNQPLSEPEEEPLKVQDPAIDEAINQRKEQFNIYYASIENAITKIENLHKEFAIKIANNEMLTNEDLKQYNDSCKLKKLYEEELESLSIAKNRIDDLDYDLDIPDKSLNDEELEAFVKGEPEEQQKEETSIKARAFKFVKKASEKTKTFINKNKKILLVAALVATAALAFGGKGKKNIKSDSRTVIENQIDDQSYIDIDDRIIDATNIPTIEVNTDDYMMSTPSNSNNINDLANQINSVDDSNIKVLVDSISNNPKLMNELEKSINERKNTKVDTIKNISIGDSFTLKPGTTIYSDEYVTGKGYNPLYGTDVVRSVRFIGVSTDKGYVKMCATNEEVEDLLAKGGEIVSVYSPLEGSEGFYKAGSINILAKEEGRSL